jgi:hypothetical protein
MWDMFDLFPDSRCLKSTTCILTTSLKLHAGICLKIGYHLNTLQNNITFPMKYCHQLDLSSSNQTWQWKIPLFTLW